MTFNLRFPGQYFDAITKQHYNLNRYYNPELGRYMEADPIGLEGGLNLYAYAGSNPVMNTDPSGLLVGMNDYGLDGSFGSPNPMDNYAFNQQLNRFDSMLNSSPVYYNRNPNTGGSSGSSNTVSIMINNNDRFIGTHAGLVLTSP